MSSPVPRSVLSGEGWAFCPRIKSPSFYAVGTNQKTTTGEIMGSNPTQTQSKFKVGDRVKVIKQEAKLSFVGTVVRTSNRHPVRRRVGSYGNTLVLRRPGIDVVPDGSAAHIEAHDDQAKKIE